MAPNYYSWQPLTKEPKQSSTFVQVAILRSGQNACNLNGSIEDLWQRVVRHGLVLIKVSQRIAASKS
jgi:hypothetical protein